MRYAIREDSQDFIRSSRSPPRPLVKPHVRAGRLKILKVETPHPPNQAVLAWRAGENGRALRWWIERLAIPAVAGKLFF